MGSLGIRNLSWQQVVVSLALLAAVVVAYKLFGELPAGVVLVISGVVNLLLGRRPNDAEHPDCPGRDPGA